MAKLVSIEAENVMAIRTFFLEVNENRLIKICGRNGQGKTTALNLVEMLLNTRAVPDEPIRNGEKRAHIVGEFTTAKGTIKVERDFTEANKKGRLKVSVEAGSSMNSPQEVVDALLGEISQDPLRFSELGVNAEERRKQINILTKALKIVPDEVKLRRIVPYEFDLGSSAEEAFANALSVVNEKKTVLNKDIDYARRVVERFQNVEPTNYVSINDIIREKETANAKNELIEKKKRDFDRHQEKVNNLAEACKTKVHEIEENERQINLLMQEIRNLEAKRPKIIEERKQLESDIITAEAIKRGLGQEIATSVYVDTSAFDKALADAEVINKNAVHWEEKVGAMRDLEAKKAEYEELRQKEAQLLDYKKKLISEANFPVPGLGWEDTVTFNGVPLRQLGKADKIRVGFAIAMAQNPKLKVIRIDNGNELDSENLKLVEEMADQYDATVLMVMVDETKSQGIVIEDGEIVKNEYQ